MHQREMIMRAWDQQRANRADTPSKRKADQFFQYMRDNPDLCWDELSQEFRNKYYDAFDEIIPVVLATDDPLILYNLTRYADFNNSKEVEAAHQLIRNVDGEKHQVTLRTLVEKSSDDFVPTLKSKKNLPKSVRAVFTQEKSEKRPRE